MTSRSVRSYTPNNWVQIAPLLKDWPFKPLTRHDHWPEAKHLALTCERIKGALGSANGAAWIAEQQGQARGLACLTMLDWDSDQLGMRAARIDHLIAEGSYDEQRQVKEALLEQILLEAHDRGVWHLSVRIDASDLSALHVLEEAGFITVDGILTIALDLERHRSIKPPDYFKIRLATPNDAESVADLARTAFIYDRFHADPFIRAEHANELHATWLRNSCMGQAADAVVLAEDDTGLLGFITCVLNPDTGKQLGRMVGTVVMVASAERARGRGVAYHTLMAAVDWFREQGCEIVDSGTQVRNIPCLGLFQKCGFRIVGSSVSLRRLL